MMPWRRALLVLILIGLAIACLGCPGAAVAPAKPPAVDPPKVEAPAPPATAADVPLVSPPENESPQATRERQLSELFARQSAELHATAAMLKQATKERRQAEDEARLAPVRAAITWVTWIGFLAGVAGAALRVALFFWNLPIGGGTAWALMVGGPVVALMAQGFGLALPWLAIAGLVALGLGVVILVVLVLRRWGAAHRALADEYRRASDALGRHEPKIRKYLDEAAIERQRLAGVLHLNNRALKAVR